MTTKKGRKKEKLEKKGFKKINHAIPLHVVIPRGIIDSTPLPFPTERAQSADRENLNNSNIMTVRDIAKETLG
jgi:hypothetical protein